MARAQFYNVGIDQYGNAVSTTRVTVYEAGTTNTVTLYDASSGFTLKSNPFTSSNGDISFFVEPGSYDVVIADESLPPAYTTRTVRFDAIPAIDGVLSQTIDDGSIVDDDISDSAAVQYTKVDYTGIVKVCENSSEETTTSTSYTDLASLDVVEGIVLPEDGLIFVAYRGRMKNSGASQSYAALFLNSNQVVIAKSTVGTLAPQEASASNAYYNPITTTTYGLVTISEVPGTDTADPSGNGTIVGGRYNTTSSFGKEGGITVIEADAGTYDVSVKYKVSGNTGYFKSRKLWVWTQPFT